MMFIQENTIFKGVLKIGIPGNETNWRVIFFVEIEKKEGKHIKWMNIQEIEDVKEDAQELYKWVKYCEREDLKVYPIDVLPPRPCRK